MDQAKFDQIARQLSGTATRRVIVKGAAAATFGALVGVLGLRSAEAAKRGSKGDFCERNQLQLQPMWRQRQVQLQSDRRPVQQEQRLLREQRRVQGWQV